MSVAVPIRLGMGVIVEDPDTDYFAHGEMVATVVLVDGIPPIERDFRYLSRDGEGRFRTLTWPEFVAECRSIWGDGWRAEAIDRLRLSAPQLDVWQAFGRTSDPYVTGLLMACVACRQGNVALPV